ncbi:MULTISPECIES: ferredoxin--NADP reductase [Pseudidiomarina]|uniref:ferredoxin--NADP(+) reductase n=2 Tax=Pseudidiomarina TaxID=2800384 RepID=A0A368UKW3_9GAMM|nr:MULTISPECIES: ferredoxin--NADP reductase [Pseudidiomarina]PWW09325.1 ferredoxin--NADP+ reductase [Pseudidiomarina maritima]RBP87312.1 ferredoxin--NADP+ reductase [Pseudidiomarina tainanensis]RCW29377.1 ferredoxin--NADP+ reductase [Pseudidiomarina tainanensis]
MAQWLTGEVVENYAWNQDLFTLKVRTPKFDFIAGQFVRLGLEVDGQRIQRAYSLVNAPTADELEFLVNRIQDGLLSPLLHGLQAGQRIEVSQPPSGFFTLNEVPDGESLWLIATGTGVGPYFSMLGTAEPWQRFKRIHLVHAVRYASDLAYQNLAQQWLQQYPQQFSYQPIVSREQVTGALSGRVPALIESGALQAALADQLDSSAQVMLCGNPDMIRDAKQVLADLGLPKNLRRKPGNVTMEHYW